jgi:hypothetical protein
MKNLFLATVYRPLKDSDKHTHNQFNRRTPEQVVIFVQFTVKIVSICIGLVRYILRT